MNFNYIDYYPEPRFLGPQFPLPSPPSSFPGSPGGLPSVDSKLQLPHHQHLSHSSKQQHHLQSIQEPFRCVYSVTHIWLRNGSSFWYFPIFVGPRSVAGFRWNGRFWTIFGIDTRQIVSFTCF